MVNDDFKRTSEDPVTYFRVTAMRLAPKIGVTVAEADEAVSLVIGAFGIDWLNREADNFPESTPMPFRRHHMGGVISTAGETQLAEVLELATYLRVLAEVSGVGGLIAGLKAQFHQALLQVTYAARLKMAGVEHMRLEPPALDGRLGDIRFDVLGESYVVECYRPTTRSTGDAHNEIVRIVQECLDLAREERWILAIGVALTEDPSPAIRAQTLNMIAEAVTVVVARRNRGDEHFPSLTVVGAIATVSVSIATNVRTGDGPKLRRDPAFPFQENDWDTYLRDGFVREADVRAIEGSVLDGVGQSSCAVWLPSDLRAEQAKPAETAELLRRLGAKIEKKLAQARSAEGAKRLGTTDFRKPVNSQAHVLRPVFQSDA